MTTAAEVQGFYRRILRKDLNQYVAQATANEINNGNQTVAGYIAGLVDNAKNSTKPALIVANHIAGNVGTSYDVDNRAAFCEQQYQAYQNAGVANPALGPYEALGRAFADTYEWSVFDGGRTLNQIIVASYTASLGVAPTQAQIDHFTSQHTYFVGLYTQAGDSAAVADRRARGAVVGQILGYGGTDTNKQTSIKANNWLTNAGNNTATYGTAL